MSRESLNEAGVLGLTAARLYQAVDLSKRTMAGRSIKAATAAIIAVDLADGIVARGLGVDGPKRRLLDSVVDSVIITAGLASTYRKIPKARPFIGLLAAREAFVASDWAIDLAKSRQPKKGDNFHKLPSLSIAAFGVAANHGSERAMRVTGG